MCLLVHCGLSFGSLVCLSFFAFIHPMNATSQAECSRFPQDVNKQDILSIAFGPTRSFDISSMFVQHHQGLARGAPGRRFLLYLNFHWSIYSRHGFDMLKTIASFVPEDVQVVCARVSSWFPEKDTSLGKALSREVREGRMIDSFTKSLGFAEW